MIWIREIKKYGKTGGLHPEYVEKFNVNEMRQ